MTKKKVVARKKKTSRKKTATAAASTDVSETETVVPETQTEELAQDDSAAAVKAPSSKPRRTRRSRRRTQPAALAEPATAGVESAETPSVAESEPLAAPESVVVEETPVVQAETTSGAAITATEGKSTSSRKRRRRRRKPTPTEVEPADAELPESASKPGPAPTPQKIVTPRSPTARVEQHDDAIVIRFPEPESPPPFQSRPFRGTDTGVAARIEEPEPVETSRPTSVSDTEASIHAEAVFDEPSFLQESADIETIESSADSVSTALAESESIERVDAAEAPADDSYVESAEGALWSGTDDTRTIDLVDELEDVDVAETDDREPAHPEARQAEPAREAPSGRRRKRRGRRDRRRDTEPAEATAPAAPAASTAPEVDAAVDLGDEEGLPPEATGKQEMIINVVPREECRIAIMEEGKLQEIYLERASSENYVGNIYKGIITNVEPSIQAAFIDFGQGKNGFLHISDLHPQYFPNGEGNTENVGRKMPRRNRPPIQRCLRRGQQVLVQITKEGIGTKGPTLTTYLSIPGRFLVMMPGMRQLGVSRKIEDEDARRVLRSLLLELELPNDAGFIARTAAMERSKRELQNDLNYLARLWKTVEKRIKSLKAPAELYTESDLVIRTIRDVYTPEIGRIVIDDADVTKRAHEFLAIVSPRTRDIVQHYEGPEPIFHRYGIEEELERLHSRHVPLKSGGSLVIDQTEALVAIDVNSGRFRTEDDAETTAYKIDLEAADEIPRQLRLRDLGGVIICDFIDVRQEKHKREIERRLIRNLKQHKERAKVLRMSEFGIIELTRQRQRASLTRNVYRDCAHCHGTGLVKTPESVALDAMRTIQFATTKENVRTIEIFVSAEVADLLLNRKRGTLHELETKKRRKISIRLNPAFAPDEILVKCYDQRGRQIPAL